MNPLLDVFDVAISILLFLSAAALIGLVQTLASEVATDSPLPAVRSSLEEIVAGGILFWPILGLMAWFEKVRHRWFIRFIVLMLWLGCGTVAMSGVLGDRFSRDGFLLLIGVTIIWFVADVLVLCHAVGKLADAEIESREGSY